MQLSKRAIAIRVRERLALIAWTCTVAIRVVLLISKASRAMCCWWQLWVLCGPIAAAVEGTRVQVWDLGVQGLCIYPRQASRSKTSAP